MTAATDRGATARPRPSSRFVLRRPRLEDRLDEAFAKRLTLIVAGAGFGKSTLLTDWTRDLDAVWHTLVPADRDFATLARRLIDALDTEIGPFTAPGGEPEQLEQADAIAALVSQSLADTLAHDLVVVLDDFHELDGAPPSTRLIEAFVRHAPDTVHVVLLSRAAPPFPVARLRGRGDLLELGASDLALDAAETKQIMTSTLGEDAAELAPALYESTQGWPAAVRLALEALRPVPPSERGSAVARLGRPEGPLFSYVAEEVLDTEPVDVRDLLRRVAWLDRVNPSLCEALGVERASETLAALARRGLLVRAEGQRDEWYALHALLRDLLRERRPLAKRELRSLQRRAARWFERDEPVVALRWSLEAHDATGVGRLLAERADELLAAGASELVLRAAAELLPHETRNERVEQVVGDAHAVRGEWVEALECYARAAGDDGDLPARIAWRIGRIHFDRGELKEALAVYAQGRFDGSAPADEALLLAATASAHWSLGDAEECKRLAERALELATASRDPRAVAAAHNILLVVALRGEPRAVEEHYALGLRAAERAGDVLLAIRIRTNRVGQLIQEARYQEALDELAAAVRLGELANAGHQLAFALLKRGETRLFLGRLDEAVADFAAARDLYARYGSARVAGALMELGEVYRERGDLALAREALEEAVAVARRSDDAQVLIYGQANLARVLAGDDPERASRLSDAATTLGRRLGFGLVAALLAAGWVALAGGRREAARRLAGEAAAAAERRRDRAGVAEALELRALSADDPRRERALLEDALEIRREAGSPIDEARVELALALLSARPARAAARRAERKLRAAGVRVEAARLAAGLLASLPPLDAPPVEVRTLGGFAVLREGRPVPLAEWRSRKARELLKILVAARARPVTRDSLMETLWPGEDPAALGNRLSVAMSLLRGVLDPEKRFRADHLVRSDGAVVSLDLRHLRVDVEEFLDEVSSALPLPGTEAHERLLDTEMLYGGDFLEEDAYADWAAPVREEARAAYVSVARRLAELEVTGGRYESACRHLRRVIERDRYDERAHLELVAALAAAGQHGEARRAYSAYVVRMGELGIEATPYPRPARAA